MEDKVDDVIIVMLIIVLISWLLLFLALPRKVQDLEKRIDNLEQRNNEAHEYILNKIGG